MENREELEKALALDLLLYTGFFFLTMQWMFIRLLAGGTDVPTISIPLTLIGAAAVGRSAWRNPPSQSLFDVEPDRRENMIFAGLMVTVFLAIHVPRPAFTLSMVVAVGTFLAVWFPTTLASSKVPEDSGLLVELQEHMEKGRQRYPLLEFHKAKFFWGMFSLPLVRWYEWNYFFRKSVPYFLAVLTGVIAFTWMGLQLWLDLFLATLLLISVLFEVLNRLNYQSEVSKDGFREIIETHGLSIPERLTDRTTVDLALLGFGGVVAIVMGLAYFSRGILRFDDVFSGLGTPPPGIRIPASIGVACLGGLGVLSGWWILRSFLDEEHKRPGVLGLSGLILGTLTVPPLFEAQVTMTIRTAASEVLYSLQYPSDSVSAALVEALNIEPVLLLRLAAIVGTLGFILLVVTYLAETEGHPQGKRLLACGLLIYGALGIYFLEGWRPAIAWSAVWVSLILTGFVADQFLQHDRSLREEKTRRIVFPVMILISVIVGTVFAWEWGVLLGLLATLPMLPGFLASLTGLRYEKAVGRLFGIEVVRMAPGLTPRRHLGRQIMQLRMPSARRVNVHSDSEEA